MLITMLACKIGLALVLCLASPTMVIGHCMITVDPDDSFGMIQGVPECPSLADRPAILQAHHLPEGQYQLILNSDSDS